MSAGRWAARLLLASLALALLVAGCASTPPPSAPVSPSPAGGSLQPEACLIETAPGPADEPPRDTGEIPLTDVAGGRAALCLVGPPADRVEGTAWCTWTADRIAVIDVSLLPTPGEDGVLEAFLDLRQSLLQVARTAADGTITTWAQSNVDAIVAADGTDGLAAFDAELVVDEERSPPPATPPRLAGVLRWECADPPPPAG